MPQLIGEAREEALQAALASVQAIGDARYRAQALAALLPHVTDVRFLFAHNSPRHGRSFAEYPANRRREEVLEFIADEKLFAPPILSPDTLAAIARHIIEICQEWEWL